MRQGGKKKTGCCILLVTITFVVLAAGVFYTVEYYVGRLRAEYERCLDEKDRLIQQNTRQIYVATRDIRVGERISEEMLEIRRTLCSQESELLFSQQDIGKEAVTDIMAETFLNKSMVNQSGKVEGFREMCYRMIELTENISSHDMVDIRIRYPNGKDYIVLAGKRILLDDERYSGCYLWVNEEELLLMSAAVVDVEQNDGAKIYVSRYPEPAIQKKSYVTYCPPSEIIGLIEQSPNIERKEITP